MISRERLVLGLWLWLMLAGTLSTTAVGQDGSTAFEVTRSLSPSSSLTIEQQELLKIQGRIEELMDQRGAMLAQTDVIETLIDGEVSDKADNALRFIKGISAAIDLLQRQQRALKLSAQGLGGSAIAPSENLTVQESRQLQEALIYAGFYDGEIDGQIGDRSRTAMEELQNSYGAFPTGRLSDEQLARLLKEAGEIKRGYGMRVMTNKAFAYSFLYPSRLLPRQDENNESYQRFSSLDDTSTLQVVRGAPGDLEGIFANVVGRYDVRYSRLRGAWFVVAGQLGERMFYDLAREIDDQIIHLRLVYPVEEQVRWEPLTTMLFNSFIMQQAITEPSRGTAPTLLDAFNAPPRDEDKVNPRALISRSIM